MTETDKQNNPGWHDLLGEFHPVDARDFEDVKNARLFSSRDDLLGEITGLIMEYANAHELLAEIAQQQAWEDAHEPRIATPETLDELVTILNEPDDDDPTCIECGWHRSEHGHQDHGFQRRLTDEEYAAEQERFAREADDFHPEDDEDPDDDEVNQDDPNELIDLMLADPEVSGNDELTALLESLSR